MGKPEVTVAVGSENPVKINSVRSVFKKSWPENQWNVIGANIQSGITDQPMSDEECILGATNRAKRALDLTPADYGVGIEGGLQLTNGHYFDCEWIIILHKSGKIGIGATPKMIIPSNIIKRIHQGEELGKVCDSVFKQDNSKQDVGYFGLMTNNNFTRSDGYTAGINMALVSFLHPELFKDK